MAKHVVGGREADQKETRQPAQRSEASLPRRPEESEGGYFITLI